jgi:putative PEP-CTERM system TPR-repeat lipoprotein
MLLSIAGEAALKTNDAEAATRYFEEASRLDPKDPRKRTGLAMAQLATGDRDKAIDGLEAAVQLDGASLRTDIALVSALMRDRKFDEALKAVDRMDQRAPDSPVPAGLRGAVLGAMGDEPGARKAFELALQREPKYFAAAANLANLDLRANRPDDARKRYEAVLAADPRNAQARVALAVLRARQNAPRSEVLAILAKAREDNPGAVMPVLATARYMLETNTPSEAVPLLQAASNASPDNTQLLDTLATALARSEQRVQAIATWERLLRVNPNAWPAQMRIAETQIANGDRDTALASLRKASQLAPDALEPKLAQASLLVDMKRYDDARKIATELKANERQTTVGVVLDGDISAAERNWKGAAEAYRKAFASSRTVPVGSKLVRALRADKRSAEADKVLREWVAAEPKNLPLRLFAGEYELSMQRWRPAWEHYAVLLESEPANPVVLNNAAWALHQLKDARASEIGKRAWEAAPRNAAILDTYGMILSETGDNKGVDLLRQAVAAAPTSAQIRLHYAEALARAGNKAEAKVEVETVLKAVPSGALAERAKTLAATL